MKALVFHGTNSVSVDNVPDPTIQADDDIILKITSTSICGSDLHLYDGYVPTTEDGDILGHEFMGEIVEKGKGVTKFNVGDKVVTPFTISCGHCYYCNHQQYSLCDVSNPNKEMAETTYGYSPAAIFGYSHIFGGIPGGQAQYVRVPYANVGPIKVPSEIDDEKVLFLSDVLPTGYQAAENCDIQPGDTVAVWGCGPVGQFAIVSAYMLGAGKVIAIDRISERLEMARKYGRAEIINYEEVDNMIDRLKEMTGGRGPDACIDAVGMEAHGSGFLGFMDKAKQTLRMETDRPTALREVIQACRKGGVVSIPGVYGGIADKIPMGAAFNKGLTFKMGQTHVQKYMEPLLEKIQEGALDPSFIITHRLALDEAPDGYEIFKHKEDECIKVVLKPWENSLPNI